MTDVERRLVYGQRTEEVNGWLAYAPTSIAPLPYIGRR